MLKSFSVNIYIERKNAINQNAIKHLQVINYQSRQVLYSKSELFRQTFKLNFATDQ